MNGFWGQLPRYQQTRAVLARSGRAGAPPIATLCEDRPGGRLGSCTGSGQRGRRRLSHARTPSKPAHQRRRRNATSFIGTDLPVSGRTEPAPRLPNLRRWDRSTRRWWKELWATPQATQWDPGGPTLWVYAVLVDMLITERLPAHRLSAELRAWEDRYGLNPRAMAALRWRVVEGASEPPAERPRSRYQHLRAVDPNPARYLKEN
jgi:hypothetical protein